MATPPHQSDEPHNRILPTLKIQCAIYLLLGESLNHTTLFFYSFEYSHTPFPILHPALPAKTYHLMKFVEMRFMDTILTFYLLPLIVEEPIETF